MLVKLNVDTRYDMKPVKKNDIVDVDATTGQRWLKRRIATLYVQETIAKEEEIVEEEIEDEVEEIDAVDEVEDEVEEIEEDSEEIEDEYEGLSAKELFKKCKEKNIKVEQKKPRDYYLEKLRGE